MPAARSSAHGRSASRSTRRRSRTRCGASRRSASSQGADQLDDLGRALADELAAGGKTPLWDALDEIIVQEREGPGGTACRRRRRRPLGRAAAGRDARRSSRASTPASRARVSRPSAPRRRHRPRARSRRSRLAGLSTVDSVDTSAGRLGLVLLLGGAEPGQLRRRRDTAGDGVLPADSSARRRRGERTRLSVLVAARDEEERIGATVEALRAHFPDAAIVVADDGSRDRNRRGRRGGRARA